MKQLGRIVRLQVQVDSIKTGKKPNERYTPVPNLTPVSSIRLDADGTTGITVDGRELPDVHNRTHPHSKFRGDNGISVMFTSHYAAMRERYGDHLTDGIAGESMLVEFDEMVGLDDIRSGLVVIGEDRRIEVGPWDIAHPCAPFSKFCLQFPEGEKPDRRITETLQFLENGMRGFVAVYPTKASPAMIRLGDIVYATD